MYWFGFLDNGCDAGELDWASIGDTWGVATSRLAGWEQLECSSSHPLLDAPLNGIGRDGNRNGPILAKYVA